jgi:branched-chain amino acid transport system permease protein
MMRRLAPYLGLVIASLVVVALSFVVEDLGSYDRRIVLTIGINMVLATSLNLINGFTGQFSLGHAGFMGVGAYASAILSTIIAPDAFGSEASGLAGSLLFLGPVLLGGVVAALAGLLVGIPSLRLKGDYLAIVTLGFGEIIRVIIQNIPEVGGSLGLSNIPIYANFIWIFLTLAILVFIIQNLMRSTYGKGFLAVRDDEIAAEATGINTTRYKVTAFVIGAFFAGVAGALYGHFNGLVRPDDFGFLKSVEIVVMVILGGMGSTYGVLFAAAILTYLPEWLRDIDVAGVSLSEFRMSIYALALVILMLLRPQGLFGDFNLLRYVRALRSRKQAEEPVIRG